MVSILNAIEIHETKVEYEQVDEVRDQDRAQEETGTTVRAGWGIGFGGYLAGQGLLWKELGNLNVVISACQCRWEQTHRYLLLRPEALPRFLFIGAGGFSV